MSAIEAPLLEPGLRSVSPATAYHMGPFFQQAYAYWRDKGTVCIVARDAADLLVAAFIVAIFLFLCNAVDYAALSRRTDHPECPNGRPNTSPIFDRDCYGDTPVRLDRMLVMGWALWVAFGTCAVLWVGQLLRLAAGLPALLRMRGFYAQALRLDDRAVQTAPWQLVLRRILDAQDEYAVGPEDVTVTELHAVHCITRRADYMIALVHEGVVVPTLTLPFVGAVPFWPLCLQMAFDAALSGVIYDGQRVLVDAGSAVQGAAVLRRRLLVLAAAMLLLSPLVFVFRAAQYVFRYLDEWRRRPGSLAARCWDPAARWTLRRYCELDHALEDRLRRAYGPATEYVGMFMNELGSIAGRLVLVLCGGFVLVSLGLTLFFDEDYLALELTAGRSVAYYIGVATVVMALASTAVPDDTRVIEPDVKLEKAARLIQHYPDAWKGREGHLDTYAAVTRLFPSKVAVFATEALAAFVAPVALAKLAGQAHAIAAFYERTTRRCPVVGDVCCYAAFEPTPDAAANRKVELSLVEFRREYPGWQPATDWQASTIDEEDRVLASLRSASVVLE